MAFNFSFNREFFLAISVLINVMVQKRCISANFVSLYMSHQSMEPLLISVAHKPVSVKQEATMSIATPV